MAASSKPVVGLLTALEAKSFSRAVKNYKEEGNWRKEDVTELLVLFGPLILEAIETFDDGEARVLVSGVTGRSVVEVWGKRGVEKYLVAPGYTTCQCYPYRMGYKRICRHVLAAHLALALGPEEEWNAVGEEELDQIFDRIFNT